MEKKNSLILLDSVPNLGEDNYEVESLDINQEYWQPETEGEAKRMVYYQIQPRQCRDTDGNEIELECVVFVEPHPNGNHKVIVNGSKRLVGIFENGSVESGKPVQVTYRGKKKNKTNSFMSDTWSVVTLRAKGKDK